MTDTPNNTTANQLANPDETAVELCPPKNQRKSLRRWRLCTLLKCSCTCGCNRQPAEIPIYHSSICSLINYTWLTPFIWQTYQKGHVDARDIWPYPAGDSCQVVTPSWERCVQAEIERQHIERLNASPSPAAPVQHHISSTSFASDMPPQQPSPPIKPDETQSKKKEPTLNLVWAVLRFQLVTLFCVLFLRLATLAVVISSALFGLRTLLREVASGNMDIMIGISALALMVFLLLCKSILWSQAFCIGGIAGVRLRGAVLNLCLQKMLKSKSLLSIRPTITNIFASDSKTFLDLPTHITTLISALSMVVAVSVCGYFVIGPWSLMATAVFIIYIPVEFYISSIIMRYRRRTQHLADRRLDIMRELLASIRLVKFLGLERFFYQRILRIWRQEIRCLRQNWILSSLSVSFAFTVPLLASVSTFLPHILLGNPLDSTQAFVFVGLWAAARQFIHQIPSSMKGLNDARVAAYRLSRVFYLPELSALPDTADKCDVEGSISTIVEMHELTATYPKAPKGLRKPQRKHHRENRERTKNRKTPRQIEEQTESQAGEAEAMAPINNQLLAIASSGHDSDTGSDHPATPCPSEKREPNQRANALKTLNLVIRRGEFVGVCGRVGSGKSTLLNAIMGRMDVVSGTLAVARNSTTAIVLQDAWLFNGSIKENILFGKPLNEERYQSVIQSCGMAFDLDVMEFGDATELTEFGANLSGGQRQRVSLARALYAGADLILLDDPLSAIDNGLSKQIFDDALLPLKGTSKTVVFVTHRLEFLMRCDRIVVMKDGSVAESGTHTELMSKPNGEYLTLVQSFYRQRKQSIPVGAEDEELPEEEEEAFELDRLTSLVTKASGGLVIDDHPLDVSLSINRQPSDFGNSDSLTAAVGAKVFLAKPNRKPLSDGVSSDIIVSNGTDSESLKSPNQIKKARVVQEESGQTNLSPPTNLTKSNVTESLFRSRVDVSNSAAIDASRRGRLSLSTYMLYCRAAGRPILLILVIMGYILTHGLMAFTKYWLAYWLKQSGDTFVGSINGTLQNSSNSSISNPASGLSTNPNVMFYALVYVCSAVGVLIAAVIKSCFVAMFALRASNNMHKSLLARLLSCPLSFFERTKSGSITTRFAKDIDELTSKLPASVEFLLSNMSVLITASITISIVMPWFLICCGVMIVVCFFIFRLAQVALRDLRRVEAFSLQPLLSLLASIVAGAPVIAAFDRSQMFLSRAVALIDRTSAIMLLLQFSGRWLSWRLDLLVNFLIGVAGTLVLVLRNQLAPAFAGLTLSMIIEMAGILQVATRMFLNTETSFIAVERITSFEKRLPRESLNSSALTSVRSPNTNKVKTLTGEMNETNEALLPKTPEIPPNWPSKGAITFESVSLSYGEDSSTYALDDVSFEIEPHEFLSVIGRSGSGKSSIAAVLTRLYQISKGRILIDGVDIASVPLDQLRKFISVVPQDPFLFSGTIRSNLDPYSEHRDDELWAALERCAMKHKIEERAARYYQSTESVAGGGIADLFLGSTSGSRWGNPTLFQSFTSGKQQNAPAALDMPLSSNDVRFSAGERQLLCLARALVRDSAILILDEATASIDSETESRILATLNVEAHKRTIITIVHRIESIISPTSRCDRVMVMDSGRVSEIIDKQTMQQRNAEASHFSRMALSGKDI